MSEVRVEDHLVEDHLDYAAAIARKTMSGWPLWTREDGLADAYLGLCKAAATYIPGGVANFRTYAKYVIAGTIIDGFRQRMGRGAPGRAIRSTHLSLDALIEDDGEDDLFAPAPDNCVAAVTESDVAAALGAAIATLDDRSRLIVCLYYFEGLTQRELASLFGLSEGRLSQITTEIAAKLRRRLEAEE